MGKYRKLYLTIFIFIGAFIICTQSGCAAEKRVQLNETGITMEVGNARKLKLRQANKKKVAWSSSKPKVVSVDENGKIYALKSGTAYIKATYRNRVYRCKITVRGLNRQTLTLAHGDKFQLKLKNARAVRWFSRNEKIAKVTAKGVVKAKKSGKTAIVCVANGKKFKCKVYVAKLQNASSEMVIGTANTVTVANTGNSCTWTSSSPSVATVAADGTVQALKKGNTTIQCKTGKAVLSYTLKVINPNNIVTTKSDLPSNTRADKLTVTVNSYPANRTYTIWKQNGKDNISSIFPHYMQGHGCSASSLATVLSAYAGYTGDPKYLVETVERSLFGDDWVRNYSKDDSNSSKDRPMPISLYGMTKVLDNYHVGYRLVRAFDDVSALTEIEAHLKTGNPVIFIVDNESRFGGTANKWTTGYHCMTMLGMTDTGEVIVADSVDRSSGIFGDNQRIKYASLTELLGYMFPCTNTTSTSIYWGGKASSGGYILINPQS